MEGHTDMAELPRYENLGVQYADLPKISTAMQQVKAQGYAGVEQSLDRMTNFFQEKAVTEAQKKALKYAIELPPTPEQLLEAKKTGQMPVIKGAGSVFTETYNKASAHILGNQLQTEFQNRLALKLSAMERGFLPVDVSTLQRDLRDDIDGTISVLTAIDPETSIKFRASMATVGHTVYKQALAIDEKNEKFSFIANQETAIANLKPVIENVIKAYTELPTSSYTKMQAADLEDILQNIIQPLTNADSITKAGTNQYAIKAYEIVQEAKVGAVLGKLLDPEFAPTVGDAAIKLSKGDVGEFTGLYQRLDTDTKNKIRTAHMKAVSDATQLNTAEEARLKAEQKTRGNELTIEFLRPSTTPVRKQEILTELIRLNEINLTTAIEMQKPKAAEPNPVLEADLYDLIKRGVINDLNHLTPYIVKLTDSEYKSLARALTDEGHRKALDLIANEAGLIGLVINPSQEQIKKEQGLKVRFKEELMVEIKDSTTGKMRFQTATEAAAAAVKNYNSDANVSIKNLAREDAKKAVDRFFLENPKYAKPNTSLDQTDFTKVPGLSKSEIDDLNKYKKIFKDNL